jgi:hypothetical protein
MWPVWERQEATRTEFWLLILKEGRGDLVAGERIMLKWILKNKDDRERNGFIWLCVRSGSRLF